MYKWAVRRMIRRKREGAARGRSGATPGRLRATMRCSCSPARARGAVSTGAKPAIEAFLRRFLDAGHRGRGARHRRERPAVADHGVHAVLRPRLGRRGQPSCTRTGRSLFARVVWGKIVYHEDFEDTHKVEAFDRYLAQRGSGIAAPGQLISGGRQLPATIPTDRGRRRAPRSGTGSPSGVPARPDGVCLPWPASPRSKRRYAPSSCDGDLRRCGRGARHRDRRRPSTSGWLVVGVVRLPGRRPV